VVRIGEMTPQQLEAALAPYISYENRIWLHAQSPDYMTIAELLQQVGITDANHSIALTLAKADGKPLSLQVSAVESNQIGNDQIAIADLNVPVPLYRRHPRAPYWFEYLPDVKTLYVQYNVCKNDPKNPFDKFCDQLFAAADSYSVERLVIDLRFNSGGNSEVINPLLKAIQARPTLNAKGHFFVLIGPGTFSSGETAVEEFHNSFARFPGLRFNATLIGEPTGGKPNCYGDVRVFELPNSQLLVQYSTKHFQLSENDDPPSREPDIEVTRSLTDYLAGRDPVVDAALAYPLPITAPGNR
jgi:hypothetical protein